MKQARTMLFLFFLTVVGATGTAEPLIVTYPAHPKGDTRLEYSVRLLDLALSKSGLDYQIVPKPRPASNERVVFLMQSEGAYDVAFLGTRPEIESRLRAIYFPMYRGLLGYRIGITSAENRKKIASIQTLDEFRALRICQGTGWTDTKILQDAGLKISTGVYGNLFRMVDAGRCDLFTRAVFEAYHEMEERQETFPNLEIDGNILIKYKLASYIFVNPAREDLAHAIERGLEIAVQDGSFQRLFESDQTVIEARKNLNLSARTCIAIEHNYLSPQTAALPASAWGGFDFGSDGDDTRCNLVGVITP